MSQEADLSSDAYPRQHSTCQQWAPTGAVIEVSPSGQDFYIEAGARNTEIIRKFVQDTHSRERCPVWKANTVYADPAPQ
jgi:hypothetical protein